MEEKIWWIFVENIFLLYSLATKVQISKWISSQSNANSWSKKTNLGFKVYESDAIQEIGSVVKILNEIQGFFVCYRSSKWIYSFKYEIPPHLLHIILYNIILWTRTMKTEKVVFVDKLVAMNLLNYFDQMKLNHKCCVKRTPQSMVFFFVSWVLYITSKPKNMIFISLDQIKSTDLPNQK
jgi:hypothetical protein